jgi:hypothetical protein
LSCCLAQPYHSDVQSSFIWSYSLTVNYLEWNHQSLTAISFEWSYRQQKNDLFLSIFKKSKILDIRFNILFRNYFIDWFVFYTFFKWNRFNYMHNHVNILWKITKTRFNYPSIVIMHFCFAWSKILQQNKDSILRKNKHNHEKI